MIGRTVVRQYTKSARESTYVEFRRLSRTMASLAENDALSCKINGKSYPSTKSKNKMLSNQIN